MNNGDRNEAGDGPDNKALALKTQGPEFGPHHPRGRVGHGGAHTCNRSGREAGTGRSLGVTGHQWTYRLLLYQ